MIFQTHYTFVLNPDDSSKKCACVFDYQEMGIRK